MNQPNIIYEDDYILALNKPSGLVVNRSSTAKGVTLQDQVEDMIVFEDEEEESEFTQRGGIIHRLDKDTSGIIVLAKTEDVFNRVQHQFKKRKVEKTYVVLCEGEIKDDLFDVDAPIARNPNNRMKYAVVDGGREAMTKFEKIKEVDFDGNKATWLYAYPKTGRTHQIRVHLAALGHPVVGDPIYMSARKNIFWETYFHRLMLHAHKIKFTHPGTLEKMELVADLPNEFSL